MPERLLEKIGNRTAVVGVVGLGYVGLPLVIEFGKKGFPVIGFDVDASKVDRLGRGESYIEYIPPSTIDALFVKSGRVGATTDFRRISDCDAVLICVPTPLTEHLEPDMSYIVSTGESIGPYVRKQQLIVLESTTYPGTTDEVLLPILEKLSGLRGGQDFFVAYSPEREDPNNKQFSTSTIPKVVGGLTPACLTVAKALYDAVIVRTVPVSSCRVAEATKLMENIFRCVNIALVNELKMVFTRMGIDVWEVIEAAKTKPFGFMPFYPGPGLGGHCIPIDPYYLTWKAKEYDIRTRFIELAGEINTRMPDYVIQQTMLALNEAGKCVRGCRILLVGLAYKSNVDDLRESPTFQIWEKLRQHGARIDYLDPHISEVPRTRRHPELAGIKSKRLDEIAGEGYDAAIVCTAHDRVDHAVLAQAVGLVIDTRHACKAAPNVVRA